MFVFLHNQLCLPTNYDTYFQRERERERETERESQRDRETERERERVHQFIFRILNFFSYWTFPGGIEMEY